MIDIGRQIADLRNKRGLSVRQLADQIGIDYSNISKIERGTYNPSIKIINRILDALDAKIIIKETMNTLEELRDYINEHDEWQLKANQIIERNGWNDETGDTWGMCSDGVRRLIMTDDGTADIIYIEK